MGGKIQWREGEYWWCPLWEAIDCNVYWG